MGAVSEAWMRVFWVCIGFWHGYCACYFTPPLVDLVLRLLDRARRMP